MTGKEYRSVKSDILKIAKGAMTDVFKLLSEKGYTAAIGRWGEYCDKDLGKYGSGAEYIKQSSKELFYVKTLPDFAMFLENLLDNNVDFATPDDVAKFKAEFDAVYDKMQSAGAG